MTFCKNLWLSCCIKPQAKGHDTETRDYLLSEMNGADAACIVDIEEDKIPGTASKATKPFKMAAAAEHNVASHRIIPNAAN